MQARVGWMLPARRLIGCDACTITRLMGHAAELAAVVVRGGMPETRRVPRDVQTLPSAGVPQSTATISVRGCVARAERQAEVRRVRSDVGCARFARTRYAQGQLRPAGWVRRVSSMWSLPKPGIVEAKSTRPVLQSLNVKVRVPHGLLTIVVGSKFGIQRPPVV